MDGKPVAETIYFDNKYQVKWSKVLESILGSYVKVAQEKHSQE